jgi:hypothetical protein
VTTTRTIVAVLFLWMVVAALPILSVWLVCIAHTYSTPWLAYTLACVSLAVAWAAAVIVDGLERR